MGVERRSIVEDYSCAGSEGGDEPMPHHPSRGCEVEHSIAGPNVTVEDVLFFVLDQGSGCRMDDAFWCSGGAAGI